MDFSEQPASLRHQRIILFDSYGNVLPFVIACMAKALTELGCAVMTVPRFAEGSPAPDHHILQSVLDFKPDVAFFLGSNGLIRTTDGMEERTHFLHVNKIPYAIFLFDFPLKLPRLLYYDHTYLQAVFCWDRSYLPVLGHYGFSNAHYLPLGTDQSYFFPPNGARDSIDVSFVGSILDDSVIINHRQKLPPDLLSLAESLIRDKMLNLSTNIYIPGVIDREDVQSYYTDFYGYINTRHLTYSRKSFLYHLSRLYPLHIYGNLAWQKVSNDRMFPSPPVDYRQEILSVFHQSRINLNVSAAQLASSVNQRVFDCFGSGNFLLTDYREDLDTLFETPIPFFRSKEELADMTGYYLTHNDEREELTARIQREILARHTWQHRMKQALEALSHS